MIFVCSAIKSSLNLDGRIPLKGVDRSATLLVSFARLLRTTGLLNKLLLTGGRSRNGVVFVFFSALGVWAGTGAGTGAGEDVDVKVAEDNAGMIAPLFLHALPSSTWLT